MTDRPTDRTPLLYYSTREAGGTGIPASEAILRGLAPDGGLYVPEHLPQIAPEWERFAGQSYRETAYEVLRLFLTDFSDDELKEYVSAAYDEKFDAPEIAPVAEKAGTFFLELFHGKTSAFKDMALSLLPYLLTASAKKQGAEGEITILTATSGDTGKAALEGFRDVDGTRVIVFFPWDGVSPVQKRQMLTQRGGNVHVVGVRGNFDDTQTGVKKIFAGHEGKPLLSSANSINFGRLTPQIAYYFHAYGRLLKSGAITAGEEVNFTVPTGNFGNILAGYYAKKMGLPVHRLICASNENKVLYDFFNTGIYDKNREFRLTSSPSMDILVSSNLERLLWHLRGPEVTAELMRGLNGRGLYESAATGEIVGEFASEAESAAAIRRVFAEGYAIDPHTAVAYAAYGKYLAKTGDAHKNVVVATASPFKFTEAVCAAIDPKYQGQDPFRLMDELARLTGQAPPAPIAELEALPVLHERVCESDGMGAAVDEILRRG